MINKPPPLEGLNIRIPNIIPIKGRGSINQGSGLCSWGIPGPRELAKQPLKKSAN